MPKANELVAQVLGQDENLYQEYRAHDIPHLWGPSNPGVDQQVVRHDRQAAHDGDRLVIYYTGHGGRGSTLALWNENDMSAKEFAGLLDKLPAKVSVVMVMVQCFSGGYADMIYEGGDPAKGLSERDRCGFFATVSDRVAAGCTSDVDEENYREYSTYFWAALYGQTRDRSARPPAGLRRRWKSVAGGSARLRPNHQRHDRHLGQDLRRPAPQVQQDQARVR